MSARVDLEVDVRDATRAIRDVQDALPDAGKRSVRQLSVLAEGAMKKEAPEGAGRNVHLRESVRTTFSQGGTRALVRPRKRTEDGRLLAQIVTGSPSWSEDNPPPLGPLMAWTAAKWGDGSVQAAAILRNHLVHEGVTTFPNRFVDRSLKAWLDQVEDVAGEAVRHELGVD